MVANEAAGLGINKFYFAFPSKRLFDSGMVFFLFSYIFLSCIHSNKHIYININFINILGGQKDCITIVVNREGNVSVCENI